MNGFLSEGIADGTMDNTCFLVFITYQQEGCLLEMAHGVRYSVGSGPKDDCRIGTLAPSVFTVYAEGSSVVIRFSLLKKQTLSVNSINTIHEIPGLVIYIREYLIVQDRSIWLREGQRIRIGRTDGADVQIINPFVSSEHLIVEKRNGKLYLEDRHSANGTFIHSRRISSQVLDRGESFYILTMRFLYDGDRLLGQNIYDSFYDHTYGNVPQEKQQEESPAYEMIPRPEQVDLKLQRLDEYHIHLERFQQDFIVIYRNGGQEQKLPMYLFERDFAVELISPKSFRYNGDSAVLYPAKASKSLKLLWKYLTLEELIPILQSFFAAVQRLDDNKDIDVRHILVDLSAIYVNVIKLQVNLIYIPFSEISMTRHDDYMNAVRYAIADVLGTFIANTAQEKAIIEQLRQILTNALIPFGELDARLGKLCDQLNQLNDIYRDEESLLERISSRTTKV